MNHRERVLAAVNHQEADRVPLALWGSAYGLTDPLYLDLLEFLKLGQPAEPIRPRFGHSVNYYDERILDLLDIDVRHVWLGFTDMAGPSRGGGMDAWGIGWRQIGIYLSAVQHPLNDATTADLEAYPWPEPEKLVNLEVLKERARQLSVNTDYAIVGRAVDSYGPLERSSLLRGMDRLMMDLILDEEFAAKLIDKVMGVLYRLTEIYLEAVGDFLNILELPGDDYAAQNPLISPDLFDRFFAPHWQRLIELVKNAAPQCKVLFHSDGRMEPFLDHLISAGVDIFHCLEPLPKVDMAQIKHKYGERLCFWGAIDIKQALQGDVATIEKEVCRRIRDLAPGGGYVLAPTNHLQPDVPPRNVVSLFQAAKKYGNYPLDLDCVEL